MLLSILVVIEVPKRTVVDRLFGLGSCVWAWGVPTICTGGEPLVNATGSVLHDLLNFEISDFTGESSLSLADELGSEDIFLRKDKLYLMPTEFLIEGTLWRKRL